MWCWECLSKFFLFYLFSLFCFVLIPSALNADLFWLWQSILLRYIDIFHNQWSHMLTVWHFSKRKLHSHYGQTCDIQFFLRAKNVVFKIRICMQTIALITPLKHSSETLIVLNSSHATEAQILKMVFFVKNENVVLQYRFLNLFQLCSEVLPLWKY